jgi:hypothetical protein
LSDEGGGAQKTKCDERLCEQRRLSVHPHD